MVDSPARDASFARSHEVVRNGFATPDKLTGVPGRQSGCIYREDGTKVAFSERFGGFRGDMVLSDNPDRVEAPAGAAALPGRGVYLGQLMAGHYGHFIVETLSTFWIFEEMEGAGFDYFLFHPFIFDTRMREHVRFCLERFGADPEKVVIVGAEPLRCAEIVVPERLLRLNHSADSRLAWVYRKIASGVPRLEPARRVYVSRRRLNATKFERVIANEVRIEALFERAGFEVMYPEAMPFQDQIARYASAAIIAGPSGSNLHNSIFAREGTLTIELGDPRYKGAPAPTQVLCNQVAGTRAFFIPFTGRLFSKRKTMLFDMDFLGRRLSEALGGEGSEPRAAAARDLPRPTLREYAEIGYRFVRPSVGHFAKGVARRVGLGGRGGKGKGKGKGKG